ncbi:hypothetical protein BaRGS_00020762 [Batillaria attramentaria]|uniref:Uncharacterized protein n=1 Tax=Batillaria attramentaria TaxID=370345 RepID=A0ABD0KLR0_9CAEN
MASGSTAAIHTRTLPYQVNQCRIEPAVHGQLLALPLTKTTVGVWNLSIAASEPLSLVGHKRSVVALSFSHDEPLLLCSAADDHVIVWNVRKCQQQMARNEQVRGAVILSHPGDVSHVSFSVDAELVAVCVDCVVKIVSISQATVVAELAGHGAKVTGAEYCPHYASTLVTISDDRTFKVWNVKDLSLIYQSTIVASTPLITMCMNAAEPHVAIGTAGGVIKIFDLTDGNSFRQLKQLDVGKILWKSRRGREPSPQRNPARNGPVVVRAGGSVTKQQSVDYNDGQDNDFSSIEASNSILCLFYTHSAGGSRSGDNSAIHAHSAVKDVLSTTNPVLAIVSSHCLLQVDAQTLQMLTMLNLQEPLLSTSSIREKEKTLSAIGYAAVGQCSERQLVCVMGALFEAGVHAVLWELASHPVGDVGRQFEDLTVSAVGDDPLSSPSKSGEDLTMVPTKPLTDHSPLRSELVPQASSAGRGAGGARTSNRGSLGGGHKRSDPMHQPLTFKTKVKSSGYTQAPRRTMFQPKLNHRSKSTDVSKGQSTAGQSLSSKLTSQEYPANAGPPSDLVEKISTGAIPSSITDLAFAASGQHLACSLANMSVLVFASPFGQKGSSVYVGHDNIVNSVSWSNSNKYLITASADKTAILWDRANAEVLLKFSHLSGNVKHDHGDRASSAYTKEVKKAQFFYMDRFVLLIVGNHLCLYKCHLDPTKEDIRRYLTKSRYKLVKKWETQSQNFTALSAINAFHSHLAVCAGSNRDLEIFDLNEGRLAHTFSDAHAKPVHTVALNEGSAFTSQPEQAFNVFATSSTLDCIKLWDVRTKRHVLRLEGHMNNAHGCGIAFSPCGTYIGSGSEDKLAYVYDVRSGTYCHKLRGHTDVVSSVAFHPARPLMVTGATDGKMVLFRAK